MAHKCINTHKTWEMQVDIGNRPMVLAYKTKSFCFEKWSLMEQNDGWFFTFGICMCKGVDEDSGHGIGRIIFLSMACRHSSRNVHIFT